MKNLLFTFLFVFVACMTQTQATTKTSATPEGDVLSTFINGVKPSSFLSSWSPIKTEWLNKALKSGGAAGLAKNIASLAGFLKPSLFKSGFNLKDLQKTAGSVKSLTDATGLFKRLEGALKPEAMTDDWKNQRGNWLSALDKLK